LKSIRSPNPNNLMHFNDIAKDLPMEKIFYDAVPLCALCPLWKNLGSNCVINRVIAEFARTGLVGNDRAGYPAGPMTNHH